MIVLVVIGILVGTLLPQFRGPQDEAAEQRARSELRTLATALESYYIHNSNAYPSALSSLITATPRIGSVIPDDPFRAAGTDYSYSTSASGGVYYVVWSYASDRATDIDTASSTSGINTSGKIVESSGGDCTQDAIATNGTRTDTSDNSCGS